MASEINPLTYLKTKLVLLYKIGSRDQWFNGDDIFISLKNSDLNNIFIFNDPQANCKNVSLSTVEEINLENMNLLHENLNNFIPIFLIHYLIQNYYNNDRCIIFINDTSVVEISKTDCGLLPISQEALYVGSTNMCTFDFPEFSRRYLELSKMKNEDAILDFLLEQQLILQNALVKDNKLFLKNVGALVVGETIEDVWFSGYYFHYACQTQVKISNVNYSKNIIVPRKDVQDEVRRIFNDNLNKNLMLNNQECGGLWLPGQLEFEAIIRNLNYSCETGYNFKLSTIWK